MAARALLFLSACLFFAAPVRSHGQSAPGAERATFLLQREGVSLGAERFTRSAGSLEGEVQLATGQRARYTAELGEGATITRFQAEIFAPGTPEGGAPQRAITITFRGDTATAEVRAGGQTQTQRIPTRAGAIPSIQGSVALSEQLLRRAHALGGTRAEVPILNLNNAQTSLATVVFTPPDSARIEMPGGTIRVRTDAQGRIVEGRDASGQIAIERREGHVGPTFAGPERVNLPRLPAGMPVRKAADSLAHHVQRVLPLAGLSAVVLRGADTLLARGYGIEDVEKRKPATPGTLYHFGSVGKQFTAAAILQLAEQGKLSLEDPITKYVPGYPEGKDRTLYHLLTMTSGIPNYSKDPQVRSDSTRTHDEVLAAIRKQSMEFGAGERFHYSNSNYYLLGMVIEQVTGRPYREYLQKEVLDGVDGGELYACAAAPEPRRARPYLSVRNTLVPADPPVDYGFAAGSVCGSVRGLAAWARALAGGKVVSRASYQRMITPGRLASGERTGYGFGVYVDTVAGHPVVWHGGLLPAYEGYVAWYPADKVVVALATNTLTGEVPNLIPLGRATAEYALGVVEELRLSEAERDRFIGTYNLGTTKIRVFAEGDQLYAQREGQQAFALEYRGKGGFAPMLDPAIRFDFGPERPKAQTLAVMQGGKIHKGTRVQGK